MANCFDDASASQAVMPSATGPGGVRMGCPRSRRHHPRTRMTPYSRVLVMESRSRGVLDTRFRGYDGHAWGTVLALHFVSCALAPRVECWPAIREKSQGSECMSALQSISGKSNAAGTATYDV